MKLVTLRKSRHGTLGAVIGEEVLDISVAAEVLPLARQVPLSLTEAIAAGPQGWELLRRVIGTIANADDPLKDRILEREGLIALNDACLMAPIPRPGILLSHGRAYRSHIAEMNAGSKPTEQPIGFMKNVNSIIGHNEAIILPAAAADQVDFEGEVSVVFARPCHGVTAADAMDHVFGFTIVNDVSARNWVPEMAKNPDLNRMGKQFATFSPMGPCVATCDEIDDIADLHLTTRLNSQVMQDAHTRDLIWNIPELIAYYSAWYPFQAGDVLTSGSPAGVGYGRNPKVFMRAGDRVSITVDGVGELSNPVVDAS